MAEPKSIKDQINDYMDFAGNCDDPGPDLPNPDEGAIYLNGVLEENKRLTAELENETRQRARLEARVVELEGDLYDD